MLGNNLTNGKGGKESRSEALLAPEAGALCGYKCANNDHVGCLTSEQTVRIHSCEAGTKCDGVKAADVVWITPIITRLGDGTIVEEMGAGGGAGDLVQTHEIDLNDQHAVQELFELCLESIKDEKNRKETLRLITEAVLAPSKKMSLAELDSHSLDHDIPLETFAKLLQKATLRSAKSVEKTEEQASSMKAKSQKELPRTIVRHQCTMSYD